MLKSILSEVAGKVSEGVIQVVVSVQDVAAKQHAANQLGNFDTKVKNLVDASHGPFYMSSTQKAKAQLGLLESSENEVVAARTTQIEQEMEEKVKWYVFDGECVKLPTLRSVK